MKKILRSPLFIFAVCLALGYVLFRYRLDWAEVTSTTAGILAGCAGAFRKITDELNELKKRLDKLSGHAPSP